MLEFKPRFFVLPAIALTVLAMLHAPADRDRSAPVCGMVPHILDPDITASFDGFRRTQSTAAERICLMASNNQP